MVINIAQPYIDRGLPNSAFDCPVALAVSDALGNRYAVGVCSIVDVYQKGSPYIIYSIDVPKEINDWIREFDKGHTVTPISFELPIDELLNGG